MSNIIFPGANGDSTLLIKKTIFHVVKENETIEELAEFYEIKATEIRNSNNLKPNQNPPPHTTLTLNYYFK